ncbi:hypothetical protein Dsin_032171 [Dipteronia sinensis]|uniref:Reverse transcriptase zinc-binding domain-containing protein n=1 Tax=Dipteronia sinensis TaxID=43782 RepID=A0AAD9ZMY3_9ROSI|nr:hypothetical protein Dsin_032171 [Dipteronia sinensis]
MIRHLWNLVYGTNNLWTSWIKAYHLKGSNLWENIPRMGFIHWLAIKGRLSTLDRVHRYDSNVIATCILCKSQNETHAHLIFECLYSKAIWTQLLNKCGCSWTGLN